MNIESFKSAILPILESEDVFLVDLFLKSDNVVELYIDAVDGVNITKCIFISKAIENLYDRDVEDFELTVSSAGIGYPFKVEGQYRKNIGRYVEIITEDGKKEIGRMLAFDSEKIQVEIEEMIKQEGKKKKVKVLSNKDFDRSNIKSIKDIIKF